MSQNILEESKKNMDAHCMRALLVVLYATIARAYTFLPYGSRRPALQPADAQHQTQLEAMGISDCAGPFASAHDAAALVQRWLDEYWQCHRLDAGGNSCFEFGGCHKYCWWREQTPSIRLTVQTHGTPSAALGRLRAREAADCELPSDVHALTLRASFVSFGGSHHYCALLPVDVPMDAQPAGAASLTRRATSDVRMQVDEEDEEEVTPSLTTLQAWRWAKLTLPPLITGASLADGEAEPGSALFNMLAIRVPFLLGCVVLLTNVLLGGGVRVGEVAWPPVDPPPPSWPSVF